MQSLAQEFKAEETYWHFLGMGIVTGAAYYVYWIARNLEVFFNKYPTLETAFPGFIKKTALFLWIAAAFGFLATPLAEDFMFEALLEREFVSSGIYAILSYVFLATYIVFYYIVVFRMRKLLTQVFEQKQLTYEINVLWTVLFNFVYLYHALKQAEMPAVQEPASPAS